jgi:chemotaxis protein MotB
VSAPVQPVIIVKKKVGHGGHHGGAWKVAYADFVTAMMAFFLVMWLVGQSKATKEGIGAYFRDPSIFESSGGGVLPGADSIEDPRQSVPIADAETERRRLEAAVEHIRESLSALPAFQGLKDQIEFTVTTEGLRIDLVDKDDSSFFASGSAILRPETEHILAAIAKELGSIEHDIVVEGHTDSQPYATTGAIPTGSSPPTGQTRRGGSWTTAACASGRSRASAVWPTASCGCPATRWMPTTAVFPSL